MESIKAHLLTLLDEVVQTLELAKKVKANDKKEVNKLLKLASSDNEFIDMNKLTNQVDELTDKIDKEENVFEDDNKNKRNYRKGGRK